jgi:diguanylate cyclase (GGDEF)-like protein
MANWEGFLLKHTANQAGRLQSAILLDSCAHEIQDSRTAEASLQAMINAIPDTLFILHQDGTFLDCNTGKGFFNLPREFFIGKNVDQLLPSAIAASLRYNVNRAIETGDLQLFEYLLPSGGKIEYYETRVAVCGPDQALIICRNVTDRKRMEDQLKLLSLHDALTNCYNRTFFEEEMRRFEKQRDNQVGLLMCDVDGLKIVNDSLGHDAGDEILKSVADILRTSFRSGDIISRIGGDEFVVLLTTNSVSPFESSYRRIKERILEHNAKHPILPISLSIGFAVGSKTPVDMNALFKEADNNMYREKLRQKESARSAIVQGLVKALEVRDFITDGHGDRLQTLLENFARTLCLPEQSLPDLCLLAHFHDIGKVGIPDSILFKPGPLTSEEWIIMRQHCEIGHRIANSTPDLDAISNWILRHQEWWNGKGYPLGISGETIPLECRILSIVDAFDAMTNDRPYRKALDLPTAAEELRRCAGTQFDPQLVIKFTSQVLCH